MSMQAEHERCAQIAEEYLSTRKLLLAAGEMTAQELRTVKAVVKLIAAQIRRNASSGDTPEGGA